MVETDEVAHDASRTGAVWSTSRMSERVRRLHLLPLIVLVLCGVLFAWPTAMIIIGAFREGRLTNLEGWSFDAIRDVYGSDTARSAIRTSFVMAVLMPPVAVALAFYFAWLVTRTNTPLRSIVGPTMLLVLAVPNLFLALSWSLLGNARTGVLNEFWRFLTSTDTTLFDSESFAGVLLVGTLKLTAFSYFLMIGVMRSMDMSLEEAAAMCGAGRARTFVSINMPVMASAIVAALVLCFVISLQFFETPLLLGAPANVRVIATEIFAYLNNSVPPDYASASAITLILLAALALLLWMQGKLLPRGAAAIVQGKGLSRDTWDLGRWKWLGMGSIMGYFVLIVALPFVQLLVSSLQPYLGAPRDQYSLSNYRYLLSGAGKDRAIDSLTTTLLLGAVGGLLVMLFALGVIYSVRYAPRWIAGLILRFTWLPWALPGTALALGILWVVLPQPMLSSYYGTMPLLLVALVIAAVPLAMRTVESAVGQIHESLEEAAWMSGAPRGRAFWQIVTRLIMPSFFSGWVLCGILIAGNLVMPVLVGSTTMRTVPRLTYDLYLNGQPTLAAAFSCLFLACLLVLYLLVSSAAKLLSADASRRTVRGAALVVTNTTDSVPSVERGTRVND